MSCSLLTSRLVHVSVRVPDVRHEALQRILTRPHILQLLPLAVRRGAREAGQVAPAQEAAILVQVQAAVHLVHRHLGEAWKMESIASFLV